MEKMGRRIDRRKIDFFKKKKIDLKRDQGNSI